MKRRYIQRYHKTLQEGVVKKHNQRESKNKKGGGYSSIRRSNIQDTTFGNRTTN
jgi:hypothetical protein